MTAGPMIRRLLPRLLPSLLPLMLPLTILAACAARDTPEVAACKSEANADPEVKQLMLKGAGSGYFQAENQDNLKAAQQRATLACLRNRGLIRPGGVERQKPI